MTGALVTGASGFIAGFLVRALLAQGNAVRATVRDAAMAAPLRAAGAEVAVWRLEDAALPDGLLTGIDTVYHLACPRRVFDAASGASHRPGSSVLEAGSTVLARALRQSDVRRMVLTSSAAVYGKVWGQVDETAPPLPEEGYAVARLATEAACRAVFADEPGRLTILRLTETFGPGDETHREILTAIRDGRFRIIGDGGALHHLSPVDDVVAGLIRAAGSQAAGGATCNLGGRPRSFGDFIAAASAAAGQPVRATPGLQRPARLGLAAFRSSALLRRVAGRSFARLDYQIRPRAFDTALSERLLGRYAQADFPAAVADALHALPQP